jgi:hypothetical protein
MTQRVFFLNTLREGVAPADYEHWVQTVDYPIARKQASINSYVVTRLDGHLSGDGSTLPCQYLEVLEITDLDEYRAIADTSPEFRRLMEEFSGFVGSTIAVYGHVVEG